MTQALNDLPLEIRNLTDEFLETTRAFGKLVKVKGIFYRVQLRKDDSINVYVVKDKYS